MELRDYLKVYWSQRVMIGIMVVVATVGAAVVAHFQPVRYGVSESFAINRINRQTTTQYQYDDYYALQASDLFAQTVVSWFSTPSVLQEAYLAANLDPNIDSVNSLPSRFRVKKYSSQNIVVRYTESTSERAAKVAQGIRSVMEQRTTVLNQSAEGKALFEIVGSTPVIAPVKVSPLLAGTIAFIAMAAISMLLAVTRFYLMQE